MFILLLPRCLRVAQTLVTHIYSLIGHPSRAALQCLVGVSLPLLDLQQMDKHECEPVVCKPFVSFNVHDCFKSQNSAWS